MSETPTTVWSMTRTPTSDMSRRQRHGRRFLTVFCAALLLAGCGSPPTVRPPASPGAQGPWTGVLAQDRAVWSAEPGIDLLTGPGVAIRAYQESYFVASLMRSEEYLYPGFAHAVAPNAPSTAPLSAQGRWPSTSHPAPHPMVGNEQWHILRIDTSGQDLTAVVCDWGLYTRAFDLGDGNYGYIGETHGAGVDALWISMTAPAAAPTPPLPPQRVRRWHQSTMCSAAGASTASSRLSVGSPHRNGRPQQLMSVHAPPKRLCPLTVAPPCATETIRGRTSRRCRRTRAGRLRARPRRLSAPQQRWVHCEG
jgi:hypothetical protein